MTASASCLQKVGSRLNGSRLLFGTFVTLVYGHRGNARAVRSCFLRQARGSCQEAVCTLFAFNSGPGRPDKHTDLAFLFQSPISGEYQTSCFQDRGSKYQYNADSGVLYKKISTKLGLGRVLLTQVLGPSGIARWLHADSNSRTAETPPLPYLKELRPHAPSKGTAKTLPSFPSAARHLKRSKQHR